MSTRKHFPPEVRLRAVAAVRELQATTPSLTQAITAVARSVGAHPNTVRNWLAELGPLTLDTTRGDDDHRTRTHETQLQILTELNRDLSAALRAMSRR